MKGSSKPNVYLSVIMPVYNGQEYISETLESILNQTFREFEIIIVDDGSSDNTSLTAKKYAERDDRISVFRIDHKGEVFARNFALTKISTSSKYIMNHDSDDISLPEKFSKIISFLETHLEIDICGCLAEYINEKGEKIFQRPNLEFETNSILYTFGKMNSIINSCGVIRKSVFDRIGKYREELRSVDDYDFFSRALMYNFNLYNIPEVLHYIRLHTKSIGSQRKEEQERKASLIRKYYSYFLEKTKTFKDEKMNILFTVEFYHPHTGGSEIVVQRIAEGLVKFGHNVEVATQFLPERDFNELNGVKIHQFDIKGKLAEGISGKDILSYLNLLKYGNYDVVFHYAAQQWATDLSFFTIGQTFKKRVNILAAVGFSELLDAYTLRSQIYANYFKEIIPKYFPYYDAIVYHSKNYKDYHYARANRFLNSVIIPNGVDPKEFENSKVDFRNKYNVNTKYFLLCVANFYPTKRQDLLLDIFKKLNREDCTLVLIGKEGSKDFFNNLFSFAKGSNNIKLLINIPREDTVSAFNQADLFLFASEIEAFPLVLLEAQISKTPFISTDCGNARELKGGIVCNLNEFVSNINYLLSNEEKRKELSLEGYKDATNNYTWDKVVEQYNNLFLLTYFNKFKREKVKLIDLEIRYKFGDIENINLFYLRRNFRDNKTKLSLAKWYIDNKRYSEAERILLALTALEPNNTQVRELLTKINE